VSRLQLWIKATGALKIQVGMKSAYKLEVSDHLLVTYVVVTVGSTSILCILTRAYAVPQEVCLMQQSLLLHVSAASPQKL
jgi:hypothetical protein